jgi:hypothetical protein
MQRTLALIAALLTASAHAHHSGAMFDRTRKVDLAGTVKEYQFANPHVWIELMVPGKDGKQVQWSIEGEGPPIMARLGVSPRTLKPGDRIKIQAHPLRDGRTGGSFITITLADGRVVTSVRPPQP